MISSHPTLYAACFAMAALLHASPLYAQGTGNLTNSSPRSGIFAGATNSVTDLTNGFVGSGSLNRIFGGRDSGIVAGSNNLLTNNSALSFIGAGNNNTIIGGFNTVIVSGVRNTNFAGKSVIVGGQQNIIGSNSRSSTIAGGEFNAIETINPVLGTQTGNLFFATIGGGQSNLVGSNGLAAAIGGGRFNTNSAADGTVGGGFANVTLAKASAIAGGQKNIVMSNGSEGSIGGGLSNTVAGVRGTVGGGHYNEAGGDYSTVPGGSNNVAGGVGSFAAGVRAQANHDYSFVWGGSPTVDTVSTNPMSYTARAPGGFRLMTSTNDMAGLVLPANTSTWASLSDSNAKTDIRPVDYRKILAKLAMLPVTEWRYKHDTTRRYIGPMAQDFHATFGLGSDDKTISTLDTDGVALAAIKGLAEEIKVQDQVLAERDAQIHRLEDSLRQVREQLSRPGTSTSF